MREKKDKYDNVSWIWLLKIFLNFIIIFYIDKIKMVIFVNFPEDI